MIGRILALLSGNDSSWSTADSDDLQIAVAALLVEAACMDDHFDEAERRTIERLLAAYFGLDAAQTGQLIADAERAAHQSTQLFRFARTLVERLEPEARVAIIEMLWDVAYADGVLDPAEDALIRRIAGLINVSDRDRGEARLRILSRRGIPR